MTAFLCGLIVDLMYVVYVRAVASGHTLRAGVASVLLAAPALFGFLEVVDDRDQAIFYLAGLFCGTVVAMSLTRDEKDG